MSDDKGICVDGNGIVEVKVGTTSDNGCSSSSVVDRVENLTLASRRSSVTSMITLPPAYSQLSSRSGSVLSLETRKLNFKILKKKKNLFNSFSVFYFSFPQKKKNLLATMISLLSHFLATNSIQIKCLKVLN